MVQPGRGPGASAPSITGPRPGRDEGQRNRRNGEAHDAGAVNRSDTTHSRWGGRLRLESSYPGPRTQTTQKRRPRLRGPQALGEAEASKLKDARQTTLRANLNKSENYELDPVSPVWTTDKPDSA